MLAIINFPKINKKCIKILEYLHKTLAFERVNDKNYTIVAIWNHVKLFFFLYRKIMLLLCIMLLIKLLCSAWLDSSSVLLWKGQTCLLHRKWMVEPQQLYSRGGLPFSVQPIFHATYSIVHNERSFSWHSHISPNSQSFIIHSLLVLSHHVHILNGTIA